MLDQRPQEPPGVVDQTLVGDRGQQAGQAQLRHRHDLAPALEARQRIHHRHHLALRGGHAGRGIGGPAESHGN